ncbi:Pyrroline-5-carboxylate reductase [hydrothermal vent metagenome]|uniref:Pyrroline-5-carboxylate reductase n=1 Tax=hydrothermal vent metagenome TaxID=652676 RepID=A0A3B0ZJ78_9ZZZZ
MIPTKISFIGGGNMAAALIAGLVKQGLSPSNILVAESSDARRNELVKQFAVQTTAHNSDAVQYADLVVLAVKPQIIPVVCSELSASLPKKSPVIVSIAAGIPTSLLTQLLGEHVPVVRTMPNTPTEIGCGATGLYAIDSVSSAQKKSAEAIMNSVGITVWVDDEALMDAITAVSGSGPAYFFQVIEAMEKAAVELGLSAEIARSLTLQTAYGATKMALESSESAATLKQRVTSPGGTTAAALNVLNNGNINNLFQQALTAAQHRAKELAEVTGEKH